MRASSFISNFRIVIKLILFLGCVAPIFYSAGQIYEEASSHNTVNYFTKARFDDFYALEPGSLDMVFIGSSHSYCTFDPANFDDALGVISHQMGTPLQHPDTSYYALKEIFRYQTPKVVVMELYWDVLDDDFEMKQANSFFEVLQNEELKQEYIKNVFPLSEKVKYHLLPIRYQQDFFAYEGNQLQKMIEEKFGVVKKAVEVGEGIEEYRAKGYVYCDIVLPKGEYDETNQFKNFDGQNWKWSRQQKKYLDKIVALCKEKGTELLFVTAPVANVSMDWIKNYDKVHETVAAYAQKNQIPYLDYNIVNREEKLLENFHFRDDAHLNDSGVKIVNTHFLNWLKENAVFFQGRIDE